MQSNKKDSPGTNHQESTNPNQSKFINNSNMTAHTMGNTSENSNLISPSPTPGGAPASVQASVASVAATSVAAAAASSLNAMSSINRNIAIRGNAGRVVAGGSEGAASHGTGRASFTSRRPEPLDESQRVTVVRMNLFVLVRILFQYLERVDKSTLALAKEVLRDCEKKQKSGDSKYATLADAINERLRDAVGETHWAQARKIQKQLVINQQMKKLKALKAKTAKQFRKVQGEQVGQSSSSGGRQESMQSMQESVQEGGVDEDMNEEGKKLEGASDQGQQQQQQQTQFFQQQQQLNQQNLLRPQSSQDKQQHYLTTSSSAFSANSSHTSVASVSSEPALTQTHYQTPSPSFPYNPSYHSSSASSPYPPFNTGGGFGGAGVNGNGSSNSSNVGNNQ